MKISFVLPGYFEYPIGGTNIVYEYANRLAERGHQVQIVHPYRREIVRAPWESFKNSLRRYKTRRRPFWFPIHPDVKSLLVADYREQFVPKADVVFATAWDTAPHVYNYQPDKGKKFYLIQHHELWDGPQEEIDKTWCLPLKKVVISKWLRELAIGFGEKERTFYVPNGLDFAHLKIIEPIEKRKPHIVMLHHVWKWKGTADGIAALAIIHQRFPQCPITLFGVSDRENTLPSWINYVQRPTQQQLVKIYNRGSIFVHTSWTEGWGLTPAEAMACGCALIATDNEGVQDYARDAVNALIVAKKQPQAIAKGIIRYLEDESLRIQMAIQGNNDVQQFTWERAVTSLEEVMNSP